MPGGSPQLLAGLRIIDLSRNLPGPFATRMLADLGAQIIKIEPPHGEPARALPGLYEALNHDKDVRSLDLRQPADLEQLRGWLLEADVLIEGFRPGVLAAMGLGFDALRALQPRLVLCSITGYGQHGPWAQRAGHDLNFMAVSGTLDQMRNAAGDLALPNIQWGDLAGGSSMACIALLAALYQVQRTGTACHIDISMTHGLRAHQMMPRSTGPLMATQLGRPPGPGEDLLNGALPCYKLYRTQDARWLAVGALEWKFWKEVCAALDRPDWVDQHWQRGLPPNSPASDALRRAVGDVIAHQPLSHWHSLFSTRDACVTPVLSLQEADAHPLFTLTPREPWSITS